MLWVSFLVLHFVSCRTHNMPCSIDNKQQLASSQDAVVTMSKPCVKSQTVKLSHHEEGESRVRRALPPEQCLTDGCSLFRAVMLAG